MSTSKSNKRARTRHNIRHQEILTILMKSKDPLSCTEITDMVKRHYQTVYKDLQELIRLRKVKRIPGARNSWKYLLGVQAATPDSVDRDSAKLTMVLSSADIDGLLAKWSVEQWRPKIFQTARNLPHGLSKLFELASEYSYGSVISENDLNEVRARIIEFQAQLEQTLRVVNGVLDVPELWDTTKFAAFLLETSGDPDRAKSLALKAREIN